MIRIDRNVPIPHASTKGKRNPIWEELARRLAAQELVEGEMPPSVYVPRSTVKVALPKTMAVSAFRYFTEYGGRGWYTTAVEGDGIRIWKIKEPQKP